jgi:hypothetical protein
MSSYGSIDKAFKRDKQFVMSFFSKLALHWRDRHLRLKIHNRGLTFRVASFGAQSLPLRGSQPFFTRKENRNQDERSLFLTLTKLIKL